MPSQQNDILMRFYEALNQGDTHAALGLFHPEIFRLEFEGTPNSTTVRGLSEMKAHLEKGRSTWAEGACTPIKFIEAGDKVVVLVHVKVRLKDHANWIDGRVADAYRFKDGKIIEMHSFFENQKALEWAGIEEA